MKECKVHKWIYKENLNYLIGKEATLDTIEIFIICKKCNKQAQEIYDYRSRLDNLGKEI